MKTTIITTSLVACAALILTSSFIAQRSDAAPTSAAPGTPPIGAICDVSVIASVLSGRTEIQTVKGNLLAMTSDWVVLKDGSFENWVPREKVLTLRASR